MLITNQASLYTNLTFKLYLQKGACVYKFMFSSKLIRASATRGNHVDHEKEIALK